MTGDNDGVRLWSERFASVADLYFPVNLHACGSDEVTTTDETGHCSLGRASTLSTDRKNIAFTVNL
jgi:hypothetical protein